MTGARPRASIAPPLQRAPAATTSSCRSTTPPGATPRERIDTATWLRILEAHRAGVRPPQDTALGGQIGLHGRGARWRDVPDHLDWTQGCIAMRDEEIALLAARLEAGTPVIIHP